MWGAKRDLALCGKKSVIEDWSVLALLFGEHTFWQAPSPRVSLTVFGLPLPASSPPVKEAGAITFFAPRSISLLPQSKYRVETQLSPSQSAQLRSLTADFNEHIKRQLNTLSYILGHGVCGLLNTITSTTAQGTCDTDGTERGTCLTTPLSDAPGALVRASCNNVWRCRSCNDSSPACMLSKLSKRSTCSTNSSVHTHCAGIAPPAPAGPHAGGQLAHTYLCRP